MVISQAMGLLQPAGTLYFSTNLRSFRLSEETTAQFDVRDITDKTIPPDFKRRSNIHRCWCIRHRGT
ncbi:MAG: hypothetical protein HUJ31_19875 [Pseudomonadales bacterium]|nr:hypothetical protein [Pseudomonadales bacterium]